MRLTSNRPRLSMEIDEAEQEISETREENKVSLYDLDEGEIWGFDDEVEEQERKSELGYFSDWDDFDDSADPDPDSYLYGVCQCSSCMYRRWSSVADEYDWKEDPDFDALVMERLSYAFDAIIDGPTFPLLLVVE